MFIEKLNQVLSARKPFFNDSYNRVGLGIVGLLNLINWLVLYIKIKPGKPGVILHYSVVFGSDLIGKSSYLYWIPAIALALLIVNFFVAAVFYRKEKLAAYFLNFSSIAVQVIFLVATIVLISINE
jgi:hypothetical protein